MEKEKLLKILSWVGIAIVFIVLVFFLQRYVGKQMTITKQTKEKIREIDMITRFNQDLNYQGVSDDLNSIKVDLDKTDFSKLDLGLLE